MARAPHAGLAEGGGLTDQARAVIIGGGYIGMEIAEALRARGLDVTLVHRYRLPMAGLEQETREQILDELVSHDIRFVSNASVESSASDIAEMASEM